MPKLEFTELENLQNEQSAVDAINANMQAIADAIENTLSRDGTAPNALEANLDANNRRILNLPVPTNNTEPARHGDLEQYVDRAEAAAEEAEEAAGGIGDAVDQTAANAAAAAASASAASTSAGTASTAATNAQTAENNAEAAQAAAEAYADLLEGVPSTTSLAVGTGTKVFTVAAGLPFAAAQYAQIVRTSAPTTTNMFAQVTSYSGTTLTVNVITTTGSGTHSDWTIRLAGAIGPSGAGTGDMVAANNLSELTNVSTAQTNLGISSYVKALLDDTTLAGFLTTLGIAADPRAVLAAANYAAIRALLDLEAGTDFYSVSAADAAFQPKDSDLTTIAGLSPSNNDLMQYISGAWANRTPAQVRTALAIGTAGLMDETTTAQFLANTADKILSTDQVWAGAASVALTDATTIAVDMSLGINFHVTLGGNRTLGNPTNTKAGTMGCIRVGAINTQNLAFGSNWYPLTGTLPSESGTVMLCSYYVYDSTHIYFSWIRAE